MGTHSQPRYFPTQFRIYSSTPTSSERVQKNRMAQLKTFCLPEKTAWTIGLVNSSKMYMTQETFGNKINANGKTMKKKQMWTLEPSGDGATVCLKSNTGKYLIVDKFGNVTCDSEEKETNDNPKFEMSIMADKSGRLAFKSMSRGYFLGASADELVCTAKTPGQSELWAINLAARPQVNIKSIGRKRFARLSDNKAEIHVRKNSRSQPIKKTYKDTINCLEKAMKISHLNQTK